MKKVVLVVLMTLMFGCGGAINYQNTIEDITTLAQAICETHIVNNSDKDLGGLAPSEWCEVADNLYPYITDVMEFVGPLAPDPYKR